MNWHKITQYSNVYQICVGVCMSFMLSYADNLEENQASDNAIFSVRGGGANTTLKANQDSHYQLKKVTAFGKKNSDDKYQNTAGSINREMLDSNPSGNGDITSILRILPNVQYDNAQLRSTTPGEIDPANVSISGGLFYQNNFQLDGFNMNNDLDPNGGTTNNQSNIRGGRSQGLAVDTSLLESIVVQDSNISAAYGRFTGGVIEANVRKPRFDGWHANVSYQYTSDKFTQYFIHPSAESMFATSAEENYQPNFVKHLVRANTEGYITKNLGLIASFSTTQSFIPLASYRSNYSNAGDDVAQGREQKRQSYNYYLKANYNPTESFTLEATLAYMPQDNTYFNPLARNSYYAMQSGGVQSGLKALWDTDLGLWTNTLSYSWLENSRRSDANYFYQWRRSAEKNWGGTSNAATGVGIVFEGGYGDIDQRQHTLNYKSDMQFEPLSFWRIENTFRVGAEFSYQDVARNRLNDLTAVQGNPQLLTGSQTCGVDSLGLDLCSMSPVFGQNSSVGQYANQIYIWKAGNFGFNLFSYGSYVEDDMKFDFGNAGSMNARFGLRLDGDTYMSKHTLAPRFSLNHIAPWEDSYKTTFIFGANRYYGRNLLSYRLYAEAITNRENYRRSTTAGQTPGDWALNTTNTSDLGYTFSKLNVPYDDELTFGITQNLWLFNASLKYIHRSGKDEIMQRQTGSGSNAVSSWSNDGSSQSDIIALMVQNVKPIQTFGITHHYLFAFDYTNTRRSYNIYAADDAYIENNQIYYDGQLINYRDRPTENWARPFTLRLTTTHTYNIWRTKWLWNNFFRYRDGYERMVLISRNQPGYNTSIDPSIQQYAKMRFPGAFTWDMRIGFEVDMWHKNTLYVNLDIYNVLNTQNLTALQGSGITGGAVTGIASSTAIAVYELGRQFWLQVGYKL